MNKVSGACRIISKSLIVMSLEYKETWKIVTEIFMEINIYGNIREKPSIWWRNLPIQEVHQTPKRTKPQKNMPTYIIINLLKIKDTGKNKSIYKKKKPNIFLQGGHKCKWLEISHQKSQRLETSRTTFKVLKKNY